MNALQRAGFSFRGCLTCGLSLFVLVACGGTDQPAGPGGNPPPPPPPADPDPCSVVGRIEPSPSQLAPYASQRLSKLRAGDGPGANDINDAGWVVGFSGSDFPVTGDAFSNAVLWRPGEEATDLGTAGLPDSRAFGINNNRQVVGWAGDVTDTGTDLSTVRAALWTLDADGAVVETTVFGPPAPPRSTARDINDSGQIVGEIGQPFGFGADRARATLWTIQADGSIDTRDLGVLGDSPGFEARASAPEYSLAHQINEAGQVVGTSVIVGRPCSVVWTETGDIGLVGPGMKGEAIGINDLGEIVGHAGTTSFPFLGPAYLWSPERGLVSLGGSVATAKAINNRGQVVGQVAGQPSSDFGLIRAFVWTPETGMQILPPDVSFGNARSINSDGLVVGGTGELEATRWSPN